jgi:hypothetical protein
MLLHRPSDDDQDCHILRPYLLPIGLSSAFLIVLRRMLWLSLRDLTGRLTFGTLAESFSKPGFSPGRLSVRLQCQAFGGLK